MADVNTNGNNVAAQVAAQANAPQENNQDPNKLGSMEDLQKLLEKNNGDSRDVESLFQKEEEQNLQEEQKQPEPWLTRFSRSGVSVAELLASLPLIFASLVNQSENIIAHEEPGADSFLLNYFTTTIKTLSTPFIYLFRKVVPKQEDIDRVTVNKRPFIFDDVHKRISQTSFVRQVASFIFTMRRSLFEFFPNVFTVPAEEHDPNNPKGSSASAFKKNIFSLANVVTSPFRLASSLMAAAVSLPAHALGIFSSYGGDQKSFDLAKFGSEISDIIMPLVSNLNSLHRVTKAYVESWQTNNSKSVELDKYNVGITSLIQSVFGGITAIPYFFGVVSKVKDKLLETQGGESKLAVLARDFVSSASLLLKSLGLHTGNVAALQYGAYQYVTRGLSYLREYSDGYLGKFMNASPLLRGFFSKFRPTDLDGNVLTGRTDGQLEAGVKDGYVFDRFKKSTFFEELYDFTHPIQSALMLLPNAFVDLSDPYVQDNGSKPLRWIDRLVGLNSMVLSLPNAMIYLAKTRVPQLILKFFETKQRRMDLRSKNYDSYSAFQDFIASIENSPIPGTGYIATTLEKLDMKPNDFRNSDAIKAKLDDLEKDAKEQEHALKASELVTAMRIGLRHLISTENPIFYAARNEEGYTAEEQNKLKIYDAVGNFGTTISGIPIVGWFASPFIDLFRRMYKVKKKDNLKLLGSKPGAREIKASAAANNPAAIA